MSAEREVTITRIVGDTLSARTDLVAVEAAIEFRLVYGPLSKRMRHGLAITLRTPGHDEDLARGLLFSEGIIESASDILAMTAEENALRIELSPEVELQPERFARTFSMTASCGWCGRNAEFEICEPIRASITIDPSLIHDLPKKLRGAQSTFQNTGGLHAAGLFDAAGNLLHVREDVGRHNAVDQVIGAALVEGGADRILVVSGRAGVELVAKAVRFRVPVMIAVGAPTSLAVEWADRSNLTLFGFTRDGTANCYAAAGRIVNR